MATDLLNSAGGSSPKYPSAEAVRAAALLASGAADALPSSVVCPTCKTWCEDARGERCLGYSALMQNTVTPAEVERQYAHHRSRYEIARKLAGDPEEARRIVKDIAACLAEFIVTDE